MATACPEGWTVDPKGEGYIKPKAPPEPEEYDPKKDKLYGWKPDPDGAGYVRMDPDEVPPIPRKGVWCKIIGLKQNTEWNDRIVTAVETPNEDNTVEITFEENTTMLINPKNLAPWPGSEKMGSYHKEVSLKVNGINCDACKASLMEALCQIEGVDECAVSIATHAKTKVHPNTVVVKGAVDQAEIYAKIAELDNKRGKFTIAP